MQNILLDFEITEEQLESLKLHLLFKNKGVYEPLEYIKFKENDLIQVWFNGSYNDNWYDIVPIYCDIITENKITNKVSLLLYNLHELESQTFNLEQNQMLSFTITPKMLK